MSYDKDKDLLDEIKNERNNESTRASLISLFEGDKNAVFTPSTATSVIGAIITAIIVGTLWWSSVNGRLDSLENKQNELVTFYEKIKAGQDLNNKTIYENIREIESSIDGLEATYSTDKRISESELQQKLLNINARLNEITKDLREVYQTRQEYELYKKDIDYSLKRMQDRLQRLEEDLNRR
jgi:nitrogen fixation-related uncharacterized protein